MYPKLTGTAKDVQARGVSARAQDERKFSLSVHIACLATECNMRTNGIQKKFAEAACKRLIVSDDQGETTLHAFTRCRSRSCHVQHSHLTIPQVQLVQFKNRGRKAEGGASCRSGVQDGGVACWYGSARPKYFQGPFAGLSMQSRDWRNCACLLLTNKSNHPEIRSKT
jgi:hypothetical protein